MFFEKAQSQKKKISLFLTAQSIGLHCSHVLYYFF